ncbi:DUF2066 domain-containing protein [Gammaproteobacteria bacterium]|nr:DUF2066 domain-containing protein [Gammaproteobacteria bacterium]MDC1525732.1 DUF2066 domain-containing protein [Gammaproteobacteria bacterium]
MINKLCYFAMVAISATSLLHAKELPSLFEVSLPSDQYTNTNDGLNKAFNLLITKLSGSRKPNYLWKIGDAKLNKIDFVTSYAINSEDGKDKLLVKFNRATLIPELRKIGIPLIGYSRPVILFLIKIDTGEIKPFYLDVNKPSNELQKNLQLTLQDLAEERGVYLELPAFDLEDQNFLQQTDILFSPSEYIQQKFYSDSVLSIEISRVGINQWLLGGDLPSSDLLRDDQIINAVKNKLHLFLDTFISVEPLAPGASGDEILLSINGLKSFQDLESVEAELSKIFAIKSKAFYLFDRSKIVYTTQLFQTTQSLLMELRGSSTLLFKEFNQGEKTLYLEYLN